MQYPQSVAKLWNRLLSVGAGAGPPPKPPLQISELWASDVAKRVDGLADVLDTALIGQPDLNASVAVEGRDPMPLKQVAVEFAMLLQQGDLWHVLRNLSRQDFAAKVNNAVAAATTILRCQGSTPDLLSDLHGSDKKEVRELVRRLDAVEYPTPETTIEDGPDKEVLDRDTTSPLSAVDPARRNARQSFPRLTP